MPMTISAQLRANQMTTLSMKRVGRLRLGRLLAFGMADCLGAIGHTSAQLGPAAAQSAPLSWKVVSAGVSLPGYQSPDRGCPKSAVSDWRPKSPGSGRATCHFLQK